MRRRPNYGQERAEQNRKKLARREERMQAKAERSKKAREAKEGELAQAATNAAEGGGTGE
jgi:hypothetical protein